MTEPLLRELTESAYEAIRLRAAPQFIKCLYRAQKTRQPVEEIFARDYPDNPLVHHIRAHVQRAVVGAGTPEDPWAGALTPTEPARSFVAYAAQFSALDRLGLARVPFNTRVPSASAAPSGAGWIGSRGAGINITQGSLAATSLPPYGIAAAVIVTRELMDSAEPETDALLRDFLARAIAEYIDQQVFDPAVAAVAPACIRPASRMPRRRFSTGAWDADVMDLIETFGAEGGRFARAVLAMSPDNAANLTLVGGDSCRELRVDGGRAAGLPVITAEGLGDVIALIDPGRILLAIRDEVDFSINRVGSYEPSDAPASHAGTGVAASHVSLWQTDSVGVSATRVANWEALPGGIVYLSGAEYGGGSPA